MKDDGGEQLRRRVKERSGAMMALIIGPIILLVAAIKIFQQHDYPLGDVRSEPIFWILVGVGALILVIALVAGSIRVIRRGGTRDGPEA